MAWALLYELVRISLQIGDFMKKLFPLAISYLSLTFMLPAFSQVQAQNNNKTQTNLSVPAMSLPFGAAFHGMGQSLVNDVHKKVEKIQSFTGKLITPSDIELKLMVSKFEPGDQVLTEKLKEVYKANGALNGIGKKQLRDSVVDLTQFQKLLTLKNIDKKDLHILLFETLKAEIDKGRKLTSLYRLPVAAIKSDPNQKMLIGKIFKRIGFLTYGGSALILGSAIKDKINSSDRLIASKDNLDSKEGRPAYRASAVSGQ
jgi:hypothetical protein